MLDISRVEQENSIEELFAKEFEKTRKYPMDKETSELLMTLFINKNTPFNILEEEKPFLFKLMEKRIAVIHDYEVDEKVLLFLSWICKSAGISVMYCWYIQYQSKKKNIKNITLDNFIEMFPIGFPSENDLHNLWDSQKVSNKGMSSDNLLDYPKAGKSLFQNN